MFGQFILFFNFQKKNLSNAAIFCISNNLCNKSKYKNKNMYLGFMILKIDNFWDFREVNGIKIDANFIRVKSVEREGEGGGALHSLCIAYLIVKFRPGMNICSKFQKGINFCPIFNPILIFFSILKLCPVMIRWFAN